METDYELIKKAIETCPITILPALLVVVLKTAKKKNVFQPGGAERVARRVERGMKDETLP